MPHHTRDTPQDQAAGERLLPHLDKEYRNFITLADRSGMPLADVLKGAKYLAQNGLAVPTVNRNGKFAAVRGK